MTVPKQIEEYIAAQPEPKLSEMRELHAIILALMPACQLWFLDGKDEKGKIVSNPNVGYGSQTIEYANGKTREFYRIGISATTTGISVYVVGLEDKKYLAQTFGRNLGKATVTGYCIKFKTLSDIKVDVLKAAIQYGIGQTSREHCAQDDNFQLKAFMKQALVDVVGGGAELREEAEDEGCGEGGGGPEGGGDKALAQDFDEKDDQEDGDHEQQAIGYEEARGGGRGVYDEPFEMKRIGERGRQEDEQEEDELTDG